MTIGKLLKQMSFQKKKTLKLQRLSPVRGNKSSEVNPSAKIDVKLTSSLIRIRDNHQTMYRKKEPFQRRSEWCTVFLLECFSSYYIHTRLITIMHLLCIYYILCDYSCMPHRLLYEDVHLGQSYGHHNNAQSLWSQNMEFTIYYNIYYIFVTIIVYTYTFIQFFGS